MIDDTTVVTHTDTPIADDVVVVLDVKVPDPQLYLALTAGCCVLNTIQREFFATHHADDQPNMQHWPALVEQTAGDTALELTAVYVVNATHEHWRTLTSAMLDDKESV